MEMIIMAAGMIAAFIAGAYIRKPFCFIKKEKTEVQVENIDKVDPEIEKAAKRINDQINQMMLYTGPKRGDRT